MRNIFKVKKEDLVKFLEIILPSASADASADMSEDKSETGFFLPQVFY